MMLTTEHPAPGGFHQGVSGLLIRDERIILVHRLASREWAPNTWDLPGGHVEQTESESEALSREIREEIGVTADPAMMTPVARLSGPNFEVGYYRVSSWVGKPRNSAPEEHSQVRWFSTVDLAGLAFSDPEILAIVLGSLAERTPREWTE
jgi:8-oxo-dGTP diphosphatase